MKKKFDNATEAAKKFITVPDANEVTEQATEPVKRKSGRPKKTTSEDPEATEQPKAKKSTARRPKAVTEPDTKSQKKSDRKSPFSVWLDQKTTADLKLYSAISGEKTTDVVERALTEYMNRHKLTEDQKTAYKQKMMQNLNDI